MRPHRLGNTFPTFLFLLGLWVFVDNAPEVSDLPHGFFTLKAHNPTFKKKNHFLELFCLLIIEFYFQKDNFEDNFSAKIEVLKWMN